MPILARHWYQAHGSSVGVRFGGNTSSIFAVRLHGCANDLQLSQPFDGVGLFAPRSLSMVIAFTVQENRATSHLQACTLIPATCRCSFASVLPVATPPKAIDVWSCRRGATSFVADNACGRGRVYRISISVVIWNTSISSAKRRAGGCSLCRVPPGT